MIGPMVTSTVAAWIDSGGMRASPNSPKVFQHLRHEVVHLVDQGGPRKRISRTIICSTCRCFLGAKIIAWNHSFQ